MGRTEYVDSSAVVVPIFEPQALPGPYINTVVETGVPRRAGTVSEPIA